MQISEALMYDIITVKHIKEYFPPTSLNCRENHIGFAKGLVVHEHILMHRAYSTGILNKHSSFMFFDY